MAKKKDWREGTLKWRDIWPLFAVYIGILAAVSLVSRLLPLEQQQSFTNAGPGLAMAVMSFLWGRYGGKWSNVIFFAGQPIFENYKYLNLWLDTLGTAAILLAGYGAGALSKRMSRN